MKPTYKITLGCKDITPKFAPRLIALTLTDNRGFEADQLDITLDDTDGKLALPKRGVEVHVWLGWERSTHKDIPAGLIDKGTYRVDEVEHTGTPDQITIRARSADMRAGLTTKAERSWHNHTIRYVVEAIANTHGITAQVSPALANINLGHIDQTDESDASFLTRIARNHDAIATVKNGRLLFMPIGQATTASGKPLSTVTITRKDGDQHRFSIADRDACSGVKAYYQDTRTAKKGEITYDGTEKSIERPTKDKTHQITATASDIKVLRHTYANRTNAVRAAKAEWQRIQRGLATFSLNLALGRPDLFPELPVIVSGWKPDIDATTWLLTRITNNVDGSGGFTSTLEMEVKPNTEE